MLNTSTTTARPRPLRVCHAIFSNPWARLAGGGQAAVHELSAAMARAGHEVHTLYSGAAAPSARPPAVPYHVRCGRMRTVRGYNADAIPHACELARLLARQRFDVVFGHSVNAVAFPLVCRVFGVPFAFVFHGRWLPRPVAGGAGVAELWSHVRVFDYHLVRRALRKADAVVVFSQWSRRLLVERAGVGAEAVRVIQPGLQACWYESRWRHRGGRRLIHWGRLAPHKGVEDLIAALAIVRRSHPDVTLDMFGCGEREADLRRTARAHGVDQAITWAGLRPQPAIAERALSCDVAVFPSHVESFGLSVAEAMALGIPVVRTRAGSLDEVAAMFRASIAVPPRRPDRLAAGILEALSRPAADQPGRAVPLLTWDASASAMLDAALTRRGGRP